MYIDEVFKEEIVEGWKAAAYGDIEALQRILEASPQVASTPDKQGFYPLQWAALNNRVNAVAWLLENGANVRAEDEQQQSALHWCGVRGCIGAAEVLLRAGASLHHTDCKGFTPCHVAAQYGHTSFLYHVKVSWEASVDSDDLDGRSPLHWAAYKGFHSTAALLLLLDARATNQDHEGLSPLHWACLKGHQEVATILLKHAGHPLLKLCDANGSTPGDLARERGHTQLQGFVQRFEEACGPRDEQRWPIVRWMISMNMGFSLVVWAVVIGLVSSFIRLVVAAPPSPAYLSADLASDNAEVALGDWLAVVLATAGLGAFLGAATRNPGYIQELRSGGSASCGPEDRTPHALAQPALWVGNWDQVCTRCKLVQPPRSQHCSICNRCVDGFDHHNVYLGSCVGRGNKALFLLFLLLEAMGAAVAAAVAVHRLSKLAPGANIWVHAPGVTAWLVVDLIVLFFLVGLCSLKLLEAGKNLTTHELANRFNSCRYMTASDNSIRNPFDKGCLENMKEFVTTSSTLTKPPKIASFP